MDASSNRIIGLPIGRPIEEPQHDFPADEDNRVTEDGQQRATEENEARTL